MGKIVRLKDIAEVAGVSVTTVSRVLNHTASEVGISEETQAKVLEIAQNLNYQPNREARNLRLGRRPRSILFLSLFEGRTSGEEGFLSHPFFGELMHAIQSEVSSAGFYLSYLAVNDSNLSFIATLLREGVSGVITWGTVPDKLLKMIVQSRLPFAAIEAYNEEVHDLHEVYVDNEQAVKLAVEHLYQTGYRYITLANLSVSCNVEHPVFKERCEAFKRLISLYPDCQMHVVSFDRPGGVSDIYGGESLGFKILQQASFPLGIVAVNDLVAIGIINAAEKLGKAIPQDVGIVGIDDIEWGRFHRPALTTIQIPKRQLAAEAVKFVTEKLQGKPVICGRIFTPVKLLPRETTLTKKGG